MASLIRSPICTVVGHVDHGKSSLLDFIRGTNIVAREAGAITQAIGASTVPYSNIKARAGNLLQQLKVTLEVPSLLFIDTPGHAAFTNHRRRGGNLADIAIVVIDVNEGIMPQTKEAIEILINYKTPFIIALNKIDLIGGFRLREGPVLGVISAQDAKVNELLETKLYEVVGKLSELFNLNAERFDRVEDFTRQLAMVPVSAKTGLGVPELLVMILGLAQRYLTDKLTIKPTEPAKGTILEVKNEKGMGLVLDTIIYDGTIKVGDTIVVGTLNEPVVTKVKGLFEPLPLTEIMDRKARFKPIRQAVAAAGLRISAKDIEEVVAGMPVRVASGDIEEVKDQIAQEIREVAIDTDGEGVLVKADSLGSLEALIGMLKAKGIPVAKASVGPITKSDIAQAQSGTEETPFHRAILGFNVEPNEDAEHMLKGSKVKAITSDVIYHLIDEYEAWVAEVRAAMERKKMEALPPIARIELLAGYVFRQNNPAVVGVHVQQGSIRAGMQIMSAEGRHLTEIKSIQKENKSVPTAEKDDEVAVSLPNVTVGRQIKEGDILYTLLSEKEFREYKKFKDSLTGDEKALLKVISEIMRRDNPVWGV